MSFNNSFIAATQIIDRVEEKVHEHYRDKRIAQIAVPDSTLYALEIGRAPWHRFFAFCAEDQPELFWLKWFFCA